MTKHEYLYIGYIRTNCLSKAKYLFENNNLLFSKFSVWRSTQQKKREYDKYTWLNYDLTGKGTLKLNWDIFKHKTPWKTVLSELNKLQTKRNIDDLVVNKIEIGIENQTLNSIINKILIEKNEEKIPKNTLIFATFNNKLISHNLNGWDARVVEQVNLQAIKFLGFKKGVLELTNIYTRLKNRNNNYDFLVHEKPVIKQILKHLNKKRWEQFPEVKKLTSENGNKTPTPGAIRIYEKKTGYSKWSFLKEEEVNSN